MNNLTRHVLWFKHLFVKRDFVKPSSILCNFFLIYLLYAPIWKVKVLITFFYIVGHLSLPDGKIQLSLFLSMMFLWFVVENSRIGPSNHAN